MKPIPPVPVECYRAEQVAQALGISVSLVYELWASGEIASVKIRTCRRTTREQLQAYKDRLMACPTTSA